MLDAVVGAEIVIHTASPFPIDEPIDEQEVIRPAVNGTLAIMRACQTHKVKRVVITSSLMAVMYPLPEDIPRDWNFTEAHWSASEGNHMSAYTKSKTLAEKAAWDF